MIRKEALRALELDRILRRISSYGHSEASRDAILGIAPLADRHLIERRFGLSPLDTRDRNAYPLTDAFDFQQKPRGAFFA